MTTSHSDALVLFGVTGDLAYKMILPALYAMAKRGSLEVPVIGVAFPRWSLSHLHKRVQESIRRSGGIDDQRALHHLLSRLRYVSGDYNDSGTFTALRKALGAARHPAYYLAIPPALFATVIQGLGVADLAGHARMIVEKPFGRDLASARELEGVPWYLRSGKYLAETAAEVLVELKPPPQRLFADSAPEAGRANYLRFRLSPRSIIALAARVKRVGEEFVGDQRELYLLEELAGQESPYERLLGDAMAGDGALFTREDAVEAAWAVVDPVLRFHHRARPYKRHTWGPKEADALIAEDGVWHNPRATETTL